MAQATSFCLRNPETGKRIYRRKAVSKWRRVEVPEQRIVSENLWNRTQERIHLVRELYGVADGMPRGRAAASPYLFTGLLECSECGGSITIVSGRCRNRADSRYGCSAHARRGNTVCKNGLLVRRAELERQLLSDLQERVLHADVVDYTLKLQRGNCQGSRCTFDRGGRSSETGRRSRAKDCKPTSRPGRWLLGVHHSGDRRTRNPTRRRAIANPVFESSKS